MALLALLVVRVLQVRKGKDQLVLQVTKAQQVTKVSKVQLVLKDQLELPPH
jgi:hypothetical protein